MPLQKPWGNFSADSRPAGDVAADARRFKQLESLQPHEFLAEAVGRFFTREALDDIETALADPIALLKDCPGALLSEEALKQLLDGEVRGIAPSQKFINEEVATARVVLTRHWVQLLHDAWREWGLRSGHLEITPDLMLPREPEDCEAWDRWNYQRRESVEALWSTIAINPDDMPDISRLFAENVMRQLREPQSLGIPDGLRVELSSRTELPVLLPAEAHVGPLRSEPSSREVFIQPPPD